MKFDLSGRYGKLIPYAVCLLAAAIFLVITSGRSSVEKASQEPEIKDQTEQVWPSASIEAYIGEEDQTEIRELEIYLSQQLVDLLSVVEGAGNVKAKVSVEQAPRYTYHEEVSASESQTEEEDSEGGTRIQSELRDERSLSLRRESDGSEKAVIEQVEAAKIRGVVVVATGATDPRVQQSLAEAVATLLDIGLHRVSVLGAKGGD